MEWGNEKKERMVEGLSMYKAGPERWGDTKYTEREGQQKGAFPPPRRATRESSPSQSCGECICVYVEAAVCLLGTKGHVKTAYSVERRATPSMSTHARSMTDTLYRSVSD